MEDQQELQWAEAQQIKVNVDLVSASKQQLRFLAAVDKNPCLYQGPNLLHAISRYNFCWLPLLAKQTELGVSPLVAPLDCEWIWHCHRLNPLRYKADCEELYGRILDSSDVVSSVEGASTKQTEEIWKLLFPHEPYLMELNTSIDGDDPAIAGKLGDSKSTNYDLVSAVKRQSTFFYQVSRPHMSNEKYLEGSIARYKAFLYLIKKSKFTNSFCVPTYDIDLIWHSHQLRPLAYYQDTTAVFGKVLDHDDTDSNRGQGTRLNVGFNETIRRWEKAFGSSYARPPSEITSEKPISMTPPFPAPYVLFMAPVKESTRALMPRKKLELMDGGWVCVVDKAREFVMGIKIRGDVKKQVIGISDRGEAHVLAESDGSQWLLMDSEWSLHPSNKLSSHGTLYELIGNTKVAFIPGRKLEYESESLRTGQNEDGYMTAVEVSSQTPNGKAIALFDFHSYALQIKEEWFFLPGIISACLLSGTRTGLDKGDNIMPEKKENLGADGNQFMAHCSGSGCGGGGSCSSGCRGGCHSGGCSSKCSSNCGGK